MTTPAAASMPALTYARARLLLGISAVGTVTVLSAAALLLDVPGRRADGREPWGDLGPRTLVIETPHAHVTGGAYGAPLATAWVWADRWWSAPERSALDAQALRRSWIACSGARGRGVWLALFWNALPVAVAVAGWGPPVAAADVLRLALLATLGSFVGALLLPTPSRRAVHHADLAADASGADPLRLATALEALDRDQDDEPARSEAVEAIFHPIPSLAHRLAVLNGTRVPGSAAGAASTALS